MLNELKDKLIAGQYRVLKGTWLSSNRLLWNCDGIQTQTHKSVTILFLSEGLSPKYNEFFSFLRSQRTVKIIESSTYAADGNRFHRYIVLHSADEKILLEVEDRWLKRGVQSTEPPVPPPPPGPLPPRETPRQIPLWIPSALIIGFLFITFFCVLALVVNRDVIVSIFITPTPTPTVTPTPTLTSMITSTVTPTPTLTPIVTPTAAPTLAAICNCKTVPAFHRVVDPYGNLFAEHTGAVRILASAIKTASI